ncbi:hypothetical protein [Nitrincola sp. MINF-07-Sa-05]|uniref:hypothetical protein n=1 Tax=Nitrincola salilacus TaxID=3400273 RepID=UPI0039180022
MNDSLTVVKVQKALQECETHLKRMRYASNKLSTIMPLNEPRYKALSDEEVEALDQYIFRFTKLQDAIGERLFRLILDLLEEPAKNQPFLDKLNRLEQLGALNSKAQWLELRALRNQLTHKYEDDARSMSEAINQVFDSFSLITEIFQQSQTFITPYLNQS